MSQIKTRDKNQINCFLFLISHKREKLISKTISKATAEKKKPTHYKAMIQFQKKESIENKKYKKQKAYSLKNKDIFLQALKHRQIHMPNIDK